MAIIPQREMFSWKQIDGASDLDRLRLVLSALPDEGFMQHLESLRGRGRDDYPVRPMWNALVAGVVYGHESAAALLRELRRNRDLLEMCGFATWSVADSAPTDDAFGRFLAQVIEHRSWLDGMLDEVIAKLKDLLPDLGRRLAEDSKAIASFGSPVRDEKKRAKPDGRRDIDADHGVKTYRGLRKDGTPWEKVVKWFGYKLHLVVDTTYELPLGFKVTKASVSDVTQALPLIEDLEGRHPDLVARAEELAADKGYDSGEVHADLHDKYGIKPVIDTRRLWKEEKTRPVVRDRVDSFVYDERGGVFCVCPEKGEVRQMAYMGFEKGRETLKYRCPAAEYGLECAGRKQCEALATVGTFGRTLRIPLDLDRRIFTPIPRDTPTWKKAYARRTAIERVNSRIDRVLGFESHTIRGLAKMEARVGLGLLVLLAMALGRIQANQADLMRSMTAPVRGAA